MEFHKKKQKYEKQYAIMFTQDFLELFSFILIEVFAQFIYLLKRLPAALPNEGNW